MTKYTREESDESQNFVQRLNYMKNKYQSKALNPALFVPFEQTEMPIPVSVDNAKANLLIILIYQL